MQFTDPVFKGCTRPAMFVGVPMVPLVTVSVVFIILSVWAFYLVSPYLTLILGMVYLPVVLWMRHVTKRDDQRLKQIMMRSRMRTRQIPGRALWGAISYSPIRYKRRRAT